MQQGFVGRVRIKVARFAPEGEVGNEGAARKNVFAHLFVVNRQQLVPAHHKHRGQHKEQGRENALDAAHIKIRKPEVLLLQSAQDDRADQVAGYHEEDVHPDEATPDVFGESVVQHHRDHRNRAQAINVGAVLGAVGIRRHGGRTGRAARGET
ncbi:hypothetical protein D9M68_670600 [compost metagenome]